MGKRQIAPSNSLLTFFVQVFDRSQNNYFEDLVKEQVAFSKMAGISFTETNKMNMLELDIIRGYLKQINKEETKIQSGLPNNPNVMGTARIF